MKNSFIQKLGFEEESEEVKPFGIEPQFTGRAIMLEVRKKDGLIEQLPYSYIGRISLDKDQNIILYVGEWIVTIKGRNLKEMLKYTQSNRLLYLQEDYSGTDTGETELFIESIEITQRESSNTPF